MELLADRRIHLDARPAPAARPVLEAVFIGHCPPDGPARWDRLAADARLLDEIRRLGFRREADRLRALAGGAAAEEGDHDLQALYRLPIPIYSLGQFQDLFPGVFEADARYRSLLAGTRAWLPLAVQDYFQSTQALPDGAKKLWVLRVPEAEGRAAFLPDDQADLLDLAPLGAFDRALLIPAAGILALPDLERLQVPARLPDQPPLRQAAATPRFQPCAQAVVTGPLPAPAAAADPPWSAERIVAPMARALSRWRPDLQCLYGLPFDPAGEGEIPQPDPAFLAFLAAEDNARGKLRHMQFLYPGLRGRDRALGSAAGLVAGAQAEVSRTQGPWRSMAGRPLPGAAHPYPAVTPQAATRLRQSPGISVLLSRAGRCVLDDERLCAPALPAADWAAAGGDEAWRSAEIMRFMGWLRRELQALGERLVFDADPADPRPAQLLRRFLDDLHQAGALRGRLPEEAYRLRQSADGDAALIFEIELAPAFALDRIRLTFQHDRHSGAVEIRHG